MTKEHEHQEYFFKPNPLKVYNIASGIFSTTENAAIFTRDVSLALQVWSGEIGYPADGVYLDFHKKEMNSMLRYWSVTSVKLDMAYKEVYSPIKTKKSIDLQSNHYIHIIENTANNFKEVENQKATVCLPFDTELYGHWWFEGVEFLTNLIRGIYHSPYIDSQTCSNELQIKQPTEVIKLKEGSWGENNNHDVWSNIQTYWIWEEIYNTELKLQKLFRILTSSLLNDLVNKLSENTNNKNVLLIDRIIKQLLRENLLLQASDWSFLITNQSAKDYAEMRFSYHLSDFNRLYDLIAPNIDLIKKSIYDNGNFAISDDELVFLTDTEKRNNPFAEIDYRWFEIDSSLNL